MASLAGVAVDLFFPDTPVLEETFRDTPSLWGEDEAPVPRDVWRFPEGSLTNWPKGTGSPGTHRHPLSSHGGLNGETMVTKMKSH